MHAEYSAVQRGLDGQELLPFLLAAPSHLPHSPSPKLSSAELDRRNNLDGS